MTAVTHPLLPRATADRVAWGCVAAGGLAVVAALARYWGANPGHADRFLVLAGAAYAAYALAPGWAAEPVRPRPLVGLPLVLAGVAAFPVGYYLFVQIGPRPLVLWWLAAAVLAAAAGLTLARLGVARLRAAAFPLLFTLFALPIPLRVLVPLQDVLQEVTTSLAGAGLSGLGYDVHREEYVLALPGGKLRVEEACSGVRSVTALTAIAAFVAFLRGFGPARGALLVLLAIPVVAAVNVLRVILSGLIQEGIGPEYIRGDWHEGLGFAMVLLGLALILGLARLVGGRSGLEERVIEVDEKAKSDPSVTPSPPHPLTPSPPRGGWLAATLLLLGAAGGVAMGLLGRATEEATVADAPLDRVGTSLGGWEGRDQPVPGVVTDLLAPDRALHRWYVNNVGREATVWAFYWGAGSAIVGYHHPDVCWRSKGYEAAEKWVELVPVPGGSVPVTAREFRQGHERMVVLYWTQEGRRVWTDTDERAAESDMLSSSWHGHKWVGDLLGARTEAPGPRLTVVVVVPDAGESARREAAVLTGLIAGEVYRVCPWAAPEAGKSGRGE
jgi:EpsI family protein